MNESKKVISNIIVRMTVDTKELEIFRDIIQDTIKAARKLGLTRRQARIYLKSHIELFPEYRQQEN